MTAQSRPPYVVVTVVDEAYALLLSEITKEELSQRFDACEITGYLLPDHTLGYGHDEMVAIREAAKA